MKPKQVASFTEIRNHINAYFWWKKIFDFTPGDAEDIFTEEYKRVESLLDTVCIDSYHDKLINLYSSSIWTEDRVDCFMYLWRIIELSAEEAISSLSDAELGVFGTVLKPGRIKNSLRRNLPIPLKVEFLEKDFPGTEMHLQQCYELRNRIVHGSVDSKVYNEVSTHFESVANSAHTVAMSTIKHSLKPVEEHIHEC